MTRQSELFAFQLAEKKEKIRKWKARDGVSLAGCTHVQDGHYWWSDPWMDGTYEC